MEKQKMEEKTMEENNKKNPDSERKSKLLSAVLMAFVCILMMGGGTYAWFTMSNTAKVTSMKLKVASEGKLYISTNAAANFSLAEYQDSSVEWPGMEPAKVLYPCTTTDGKDMQKPIYATEKEVSGSESLATASATEKNQYYLEQDFYLYMDEGAGASQGTYSVHLAQFLEGQDGNGDEGTYFKSSATDLKPEYCARVSFITYGDNGTDIAGVKIYEPNSNGAHTNAGESATSSLRGKESDCKQNTEGKFLQASSDAVTASGDSEELFNIKGNTKTKVTVRVWFEGTDEQCCNNIDLKEIVAQLKFKANKVIE